MTTTQHREIERKFDVPPGFALPDLSALPGVDGMGGAAEQELDATYYDTADLRLAAARVTLRRRTGGTDAGWHVKLPEGDGTRRELHRPPGRAAAAPPKAVLEPVAGLVRRAPVGRVARLQTRRTVTPLTGEGGRVLAEVADDAVTATTFAAEPGAPAVLTTWREIEVELVDGDETLLDGLAAALVGAGARPSPFPSKLGRALGARAAGLGVPDGTAADGASASGERPTGKKKRTKGKGKGKGRNSPGRAARRALAAARGTAEDGATAGAVIVAAVRAQLAALQQADVMVRTGQPDGVHQVRVAGRRLRSTLAAFRGALDRERTDPLRQELRWLGTALSGARDGEVALAHLRDLAAQQPDELVLGPVAARLQQSDTGTALAGREQALRALGDDRYFRLLDALDALITDPPLGAAAAEPARDTLGQALAASGRRLRRRIRAAREATGEAHEQALHEVRKAAKRVRYTAEVACPVVDPESSGLVDAMKEVQEVLGVRQDTVVTRELCRQLGLQAFGAGENPWTYGRLHALEQARSEAAERQFWQELVPAVLDELRRAGRG